MITEAPNGPMYKLVLQFLLQQESLDKRPPMKHFIGYLYTYKPERYVRTVLFRPPVRLTIETRYWEDTCGPDLVKWFSGTSFLPETMAEWLSSSRRKSKANNLYNSLSDHAIREIATMQHNTRRLLKHMEIHQ